MLISLVSLIALLHNLICSRDYQNLSAWHRNSIILLAQNIIFALCTTASMSNLLVVTNGGDDITLLEKPGELLKVIYPLFVLSIFFLIMVLCVYHKN